MIDPKVDPKSNEANDELLAVTLRFDASGSAGLVAAPQPLPTRQPERIGRYRIEGILGQGGFGIVYRGFDDQLDRRVAIKIPHPGLVENSDDAAAYLDEARIVAGLDHPNIVPVFDVGSDADFPCYVISKHVEGTSLSQRLLERRFSFEESVRLVATIARAVHYAHLRGLVHRDIKPVNILLDRDDNPFLVDFGLALRQVDLGKGARFAGTPMFMSPEQARGKGHQVDGRSDVFSLGVVFYLLLTGEAPFKGDTAVDILECVARAEPHLPRLMDPSVPDSLERICMRALARVASDRYPTAIAMAEELTSFLSAENESPEASRPARAERERRQVTVMSCGLAKSSLLSDDPEESEELIVAFRKTATDLIVALQGYVTQHGDGLVAYFGYPTAHENDAERAVLAARQIMERVHRRGRTKPASLQIGIGIGIATGLVVVGDSPTVGDQSVVGRTPHLADRLQEIAEIGEIIVAPETVQLVEKRFQCIPLGSKSVKGFATPVSVSRVEGEKAIRTRFDAVRLMGVTPMVGRDQEMQVIRERWDQVRRGIGKIVVLSGEAGIGKSRMVHATRELADAEEQATVIELQCSPYQSQTALHPVITWLDGVVRAEGHPDNPWKQLKHFVGRHVPDQTHAVSLFADLLGIPSPPGFALLGLVLEHKKQLTQQCLLELLTGLAGQMPVLLVIEDLHWMDPSTLELIGLLAKKLADVSMLLLLTARREFVVELTGATVLSLQSLDPASAAALVREASKSAAISAEISRIVVDRADGVPLFLEELVKSLIEMGPGEISGAASSMPLTLRDSLMARLDRLAYGKPVAQIASVLGRECSTTLLNAVWNSDQESLHRGLNELVDAELIFATDPSSPTGYRFKHALVQDTAYDSMLKSRRITEHYRVAELIENEFPKIAAAEPALLAQHFEMGMNPGKAGGYWLKAGLQAQGRNAYREATAHFRRGIEQVKHLPESPERNVVELGLQVALGPALIAAQGYGSEELGAACERARQLCELVGTTPQKFPALFVLWAFHCVRANHTIALPLTSEILQMAEAVQISDLVLEGNLAAGCTHFFLGNVHQALRHLELCVTKYDPNLHGNHAYQFGQDPAVVALNYSCWSYWLIGEPQNATRAIQRALTLARTLNHPLSLSFALFYGAWHHLLRREFNLALSLAAETINVAGEHQVEVFLADGEVVHAWAKCGLGNLDEGIPEMKLAIAHFRKTGARCFLPNWYAGLALAEADAGDLDDASESLKLAFDQMAASGERWGECEILRSRGVLLEKQQANPAEIEDCYRSSLAIARQGGIMGWQLRTAVSLCQWLNRMNRTVESRTVLEETLAGLPHDFENADFQDARRLLET